MQPHRQPLSPEQALSDTRLTVGFANSETEITAAQRLRYEVFSDEMGARLHGHAPGLDSDRFDAYCQHLLVRDNATGTIAAYTRILTDVDAARAGGYYSETEFDLTQVRALPGRFMEVGRTCVHRDYRSGAAITLLWSGIARFVQINRIGHLLGCASIPLADPAAAAAVLALLRRDHLSADYLRVHPLVPLPRHDHVAREDVAPPPLLKGYLRLGAKICGEACWDPQFNCADVLVLLDADRISRRYRRHFLVRD